MAERATFEAQGARRLVLARLMRNQQNRVPSPNEGEAELVNCERPVLVTSSLVGPQQLQGTLK